MSTLLVTGGAGFIGSHLSQALLAKGYQVRILDNLIYGQAEWIPAEATLIKGDICNLDTCREAMKEVTGVFHCAAMSRAAPSSENIELCTQVNIIGTQNLLIAARDAGVKKFIYSGSSTYYGNQPIPHQEYETPSEYLNIYALSKAVGESYCLMFDKVFDVPCLILRYFNVYGPRQPQEGAYALVLGIFLHQWAEQKPLYIHGDGEQRRDFIHVNDVVAANIAAFESPLRHDIFNIGSGLNISIKELATMISSHQIHAPRRTQDADSTLADISRALQKLSWSPTVPFHQGLDELKTLTLKI